eukprot:TRINITY_DN3369_c0_g2_i3.p1 TRINITY_DN3369_c0_g2~~TRINITY_DN3369_c0_g2_i3.p1  ORF type:complete len:341 (+),score=37.50 TRINITY_DN3369_c0_g2_i3:91-1023(+)
MEKWSWLHQVPTRLQDGTDFRTAPFTTSDFGRARDWGSSVDKLMYRLPQNGASAHRRTCGMAVVLSDACYEHTNATVSRNRAGFGLSTRPHAHRRGVASPQFLGCALRRDMADEAEDANMQEQSMPTMTWAQGGRDFRIEPCVTWDSCKTGISSVDKAIWPRNRAHAGESSAMQHAHDLTSNGSSNEAQMRVSACFIRKLKPSTLGCAIVELASEAMREEVMSRAEQFPVINGVPRMEIHGVSVNVRRHIDKYNTTQRQEKLTDIFISWSHGVEKQLPLPLRALVDAFDALVAQVEAREPDSLPAPRFTI